MKTPSLAFALGSSMILGIFMRESIYARGEDPPRVEGKIVDAAASTKPPFPGASVPSEIGFSVDGKSATYLSPERFDSLSRVLWKADVAADPRPRVIVRPPEGGDTEANVSPEEALRRERRRLRDTGIARVVRAARADFAAIPLQGDVYALRGDGPLERLTRTPAAEIDPRPSDDGSKVAFVRDGQLFVIDVASKRETRLTQGSTEGVSRALAEFMAQEEMDRAEGYWWSGDGARIAYQETDERAIPLYTIVHQGDSAVSAERHRYPFPGKANAKVRLRVVPSAGGESRSLDCLDPLLEDAYLARVEWRDDKHLFVQILSRDQKNLRLVEADVSGDRYATLIDERSETYVNLHDDLRRVEKTGELLWSSERSGFRHLELRDAEGNLIRTLTTGNWPVDRVVGFDQKRREVWFVAGVESPLEAQLYRVSLDGGPIERVGKEPGTHSPVVSADCEYYIDVHSSLRRPPITSIRDRLGLETARLADAGEDPRIKEYGLTPPEIASFKSRDGVPLLGAYYAPRFKASNGKAPLIVMVYGGPHVQLIADSWALTADLNARFLADRGFAVWKMDNRGSARRGHEFEAALYRRMGTVEVRDQVDGVRFVSSKHPEIDADRVGVTGGSYGGYMTLRCLVEAPEVFKSGVAVAPVVDWDGYDTCYTERYMGTPENNAEGYRDSSVLSRVDRLKGRLLLVHGMIDENVHFRHTARLVSALIAARKPFELLPLPSERHSARRAADRAYEAERKAEFFERTLGPRDRP